MIIKADNNSLVIKPGILQCEVSIDISCIDSWWLAIDDLGIPYLYFHYAGMVQGITLPKSVTDDLKESIESIRAILIMEPEIEIPKHQSLLDNPYLAVTGVELFFLAIISIR